MSESHDPLNSTTLDGGKVFEWQRWRDSNRRRDALLARAEELRRTGDKALACGQQVLALSAYAEQLGLQIEARDRC